MKAEILKWWIDALEAKGRRKKYQQCFTTLHCEEAFCATGVLAEVLFKHDLLPGWRWVKHADGSHQLKPPTTYGLYGMLPPDIHPIAGISSEEVALLAQVEHLNDDGKEFPTIAQWIRTNFKGDC